MGIRNIATRCHLRFCFTTDIQEMKILSLLLSSVFAQSPDLQPDNIGRTAMTPEEALDFYTDLEQDEIDRVLQTAFDITQFNLAASNTGFFRTMTGAKFMDIHLDYQLFDELDQFSDDFFKSEAGPGALHKMGIIEYAGCGVDTNGEHFNITDGYVTSEGNWQFNKVYTGEGPSSWTHGWRYLGNIVGQVWNGGIQNSDSLETSRIVTQAFFFPNAESNVQTCSKSKVSPLTTKPPTLSTTTRPTIIVHTEPETTTELTMTNNEAFVEKCGTRLRQLKGQYGMETFDTRVHRQLHKRFTILEKILTNAISERQGRNKIQMLTTVPRIAQNAELRTVYIKCFKNFIPEVFAQFKHSGNHLKRRSNKVFELVCDITQKQSDAKFCNRLK